MTSRTTSRFRAIATCIALAMPVTGCVARGAPRITNVIPVPLQEGANLVPHMAPDGRQGLVVEGRQPDARAPLIMTMLPRAEGTRGWDVVEVELGDGLVSPTVDSRGRAVVLARAKVGGIPATLLFVAGPDNTDLQPAGAPHRIVIETLRLQTGESAARFQLLVGETTRTRYCSAGDALARTYGLELPTTDDNQCAAPGA